ncbi:hypothetical protein Esti_004931 [Eimeria stiedai]
MARLCLRSPLWMRGVAGAAALFLVLHTLSLVLSASPARRQPVYREQTEGRSTNQRGVYSPVALPQERRLAALRIFEKVHPTLTIHYSGFSRNGSLVCYDMLNELRTVDEAKALMDVEFHLLDLMLEHYKRYLPHIECLVIVNVPSLFVPLLPTIAARLMGIPSNKLVALSSGQGLEKFMDKKYVPKEFGNAHGHSVRASREDLTASCLMLQEIKSQLGEEALSPEGKRILQQHGPRLLGIQQETSTSTTEVEVIEKEEESFDDID